MNRKQLIAENRRRLALEESPYDPLRGIGCSGPRVEAGGDMLPTAMIADPRYSKALKGVELERLRCEHDFEYWAARCVKIRHKLTMREVPFVLNRPQRRVFAMLDADRREGRPLRLIMLKARQWGGSTLVQMMMAWIQIVLKRNWNSLICAHVKDASATIRAMYADMLAAYPQELWDDTTAPGGKTKGARLVAVTGTSNIREIEGRGCRITIASAERQDSVRGQAVSMAHMSEVAFWPATPRHSPSDFIRSVTSGIPLEPLTLVALESTANGVGSYFHTEWLRAEACESDKRAVFVPWYEIEMLRMEVADYWKLWQSLDEYERRLWIDHPAVTLEAINWYHHKRREFSSHAKMQSEFPSTAIEAFASTGCEVFDPERVQALRARCRAPRHTGELSVSAGGGISLVDDPTGKLKVWHTPADAELADRYVVIVDIGGRSAKADWSVIAVIERRIDGVPRVVAQWRGHIDHDLLADKAMLIARYYHTALLVVESNTLETEWDGDSIAVLERLNHIYPRLYTRQRRDTVSGRIESRPGFHTNRSTKTLAIAALIEAVREGGYEEADLEACNELDTYECTRSGGYAARQGYHDDMLMTRAIGLYVINSLPPLSPRSATCVLRTPDSW